MKDIVISKKQIKRELLVFLGCVAAMELLNIYAIIDYDGKWSEAFLSIGFVTVAAVVVYLVLAIIRLSVYALVRIFKK